MNGRDELRREIESVLDDMTEEAGAGVSRAPEPDEVVPPVVEEAGSHDHVGHGMVTFSQWGAGDDGELVALDPGRFGLWDPEVEERERAARLEGGMALHGEGMPHDAEPPHDEGHGHGEGHGDEPAKPPRRKGRARGSDR